MMRSNHIHLLHKLRSASSGPGWKQVVHLPFFLVTAMKPA